MLFAIALLSPPVLGASESGEVLAARSSADVVLVTEDETVREDLYAGGNTITIEGTIEGDLIVWAFKRLEVTGTVEGDIIGYASTARINGTVGGSIRLLGGDVSVAGEVDGDLMAIAWSVVTDASIGRDLLSWSRSLLVGGEVGRDVEGQTFGTAVVDARIGRDFEMSVNGLEVLGTSSIGQDLAYRSAATAKIDESATIEGTVIRRSPLEPNIRVRGVRLVAVILGSMAFLWLGLLSIWVMPSTVRHAVDVIDTNLPRAFSSGLVVALTPIVLAIAVIVTAATAPPELALTIVGVAAPFWVAVLATLMVAITVAPVPIAIVIGRSIVGRNRSAFGSYLVGALLLLFILAVPIVRLIVLPAVGIVGLGALLRGGLRARGSLRWANAKKKTSRPQTEGLGFEASEDDYATSDELDFGEDTPGTDLE